MTFVDKCSSSHLKRTVISQFWYFQTRFGLEEKCCFLDAHWLKCPRPKKQKVFSTLLHKTNVETALLSQTSTKGGRHFAYWHSLLNKTTGVELTEATCSLTVGTWLDLTSSFSRRFTVANLSSSSYQLDPLSLPWACVCGILERCWNPKIAFDFAQCPLL